MTYIKKIKVPLSFGQWDRNGTHSKRVKRLTFSIFLCGCKLSGTISSANLSTLSAAKVRFFSEKVTKGTVDFIGLSLLFGTVPFVSVIIISGIVGVDHSSVGENPGGAQVICFVDVIFQGLISVRPD